jgi:hypothetical protein
LRFRNSSVKSVTRVNLGHRFSVDVAPIAKVPLHDLHTVVVVVDDVALILLVLPLIVPATPALC